MSRIAGVVQFGFPEERARLLAALLAALRPSARWGQATVDAGTAHLGWTGWRTANVAQAHGVLVALDGAIYNRRELGAPAEASDAEFFAGLYARHGMEEALRRLNADLAAAVYDPAEGALWLACDRFGVKPLYYTLAQGGAGFASTPRALTTLPGVPAEPSRQFVALFAASHYRYIDNAIEQSPFAAIARVPGAHVVRIARGRATLHRYWALEDAPEWTASEAELAERYQALLLDATALRLAAVERPAFTLSGGMDSASVLASAVRLTGRKQPAASVVYVDKTYDEAEDIQPMLEPAVSVWHRVTVGVPDVPALVRRMIEAHEEPVVTATWLSHFLLCEEAAALGFGGLFGGLGGDELNAGEYEHFWPFFADLRTGEQEETLRAEVGHWVRHHDHPVFRKSSDLMEHRLPQLVDLNTPGRCLVDRERLERYAAALDPDYFDLRAFEPVMEHPFRSYLKNRTYQDLTRETIPCCLRAEDRQATAFGLENALPFFDHRLVEFMYRVPGTLKIRQGVTKHLLRRAMGGLLPEATRTRVKKTGWNAPAHVWFSGVGGAAVRDLVESAAFQSRGIYRAPEVLRLLDEHERIVAERRPVDNHMMFFWQVVNLELWLQWLEEPQPVLEPLAGARQGAA